MVTLLGLRETDTVQLENERVRETLEILWRKAERQVDNSLKRRIERTWCLLKTCIQFYVIYSILINQDIYRFLNIGKDQTLNFLFNYKRLFQLSYFKPTTVCF